MRSDWFKAHPQVKLFTSVPVLAWAFYDFANTIWALNILSLYFPLWVVQDMDAKQSTLSITLSSSMLLVAIVSPALGAVSDQTGKRLQFLASAILITVICTVLLGLPHKLGFALGFFIIANFAYQSGNVFYDSLLTTISKFENRGTISGLGVAFGYVGSFAGIILIAPIASNWGRVSTFVPTGVAFLLFALPCCLLIKEIPSGKDLSVNLLKESYVQIYQTIRQHSQHINLFRFIAARFLYVDAINTLLVFMAIYLTEVIGFNDSTIRVLLLTSASSAIIGSFLYGRLTDYLGPKNTLFIILAQWIVVFIGLAATSSPLFIWVIGFLTGTALGGTWTADRTLLTRLAPPSQIGEFFGLYQLAGKFAAVIGPLIWGVTVESLAELGNMRFRIAILALLINVVLGLLTLTLVKLPTKQPNGLDNID